MRHILKSKYLVTLFTDTSKNSVAAFRVRVNTDLTAFLCDVINCDDVQLVINAIACINNKVMHLVHGQIAYTIVVAETLQHLLKIHE